MDFKHYFDIPANITYLNTPGNGLMPKMHYAWRSEWEKVFFDPNGHLRDQQPQIIAEIKRSFAALFNSRFENTYLLPNFSFGMHTILSGLPSNLRIAILEDDYPSLNYPVISRSFNHEIIPVDEHVEDNISKTIEDKNIDVLVLSIVQYISGLKIDLDFIKSLKMQYPDLIVIGDSTQYLGTEPFDFLASGFDVVAGSGYKWLMSGFGNAYVMLSDDLKRILYKDAQAGPRPVEAMWSTKSILDSFFEPGHQDTLSQGTLLQTVHFLSEIGLENVKCHIDELVNHAYEAFEKRNLLLPEIASRRIRSALINVQLPFKAYNVLMAQGIKCFPRGTGIRIGLHLYNTKEDIDKLLDIVDNRELYEF